MDERSRLAAAYRQRDALQAEAGWSWLVPEAHWLDFTIQRFIAASLAGQGWTTTTLADCKALEVGCGEGQVLRWLHDVGLRRLWGCDLLPWRVERARALFPAAAVTLADMTRLPYPDGVFDVALQVVTFSSCLDNEMRSAAAREMMRVVNDTGCVIWCDFLPAPHEGAHVRGIAPDEVRALFPAMDVRIRTFGANHRWVGAATSLKNQGLVRSLLRRLPFARNFAGKRRPITHFPVLTAAFLESLPWMHGYVGAVIRRSAGRR